jgi:DHA3 family macrolide efflux protein-like MFS transporter
MKESKYKTVLKNKTFTKLLIANTISRFGDSIDSVAYGYMVYMMSGSEVLLAILFAVNGLPSLFFNLISGVVVNYLDKRKVMIYSDLLRGLTVALTGLLFLFNSLQIWHLFLFTFMNSSFESFRVPSGSTFFAHNIEQEDYEHTTSLSSALTTFSELAGYASAGIVIGLIGIGGAIIMDGITFFLSGLILYSIKIYKDEKVKKKLDFKGYFTDLKSGAVYVLGNKTIRSISLFAGMFSFFLIPFNSLQPAYVKDVLNRGPEALSAMGVAFLGAMFIGSLIVPIWSNWLKPLYTFVLSGTILSFGYIFLGTISNVKSSSVMYILFILICLLMGLFIPSMNVPLRVAIMKNVQKDKLTFTISFINMLALSSTPLGGAFVGFLLGFVPLIGLFYVFGAMLVVLFISQLFNKALSSL